MQSPFRRLLAVLLALCALPVGALALTGQNISAFEAYYKEDVNYINENTGRHLLAKDLAVLDLKDNGRTQYYYYDDALHITIAADASGIIESCEIRLLIPEGTVYGNSLYLDFVTAGYHSYAFIMAMHMATEASSRYLLVQEISDKLDANAGFYERQLGAYTITCTRVVGEGAVFMFQNNGLIPDTPVSNPDDETIPDIVDDDEAANYG